MAWDVRYDETFVTELAEAERQSGSSAVREEIAALALLLRRFGPSLRRPHCDTLKGSKHANMKELRFTLPDGEWRVAFAFDPRRAAILLVAGGGKLRLIAEFPNRKPVTVTLGDLSESTLVKPRQRRRAPKAQPAP
jgi:hypothetical protein